MKFLFIAILLLTSCTTRPILFTPQQVVNSTEPEEATTIAKLEEDTRLMRKVLMTLIKQGQIDQASAQELSDKLRAVDYYVCKAWVAMVEGDAKLRDEATTYAEVGLGQIQGKLFQVIKEIQEKGDRV